MALVGAIYVAGVVTLYARGDGIAAAYLTMPTSMLGLWGLEAVAGVAPRLASSHVVELPAIAASAIANAGCLFGLARVIVARW
jgi:hypothetical protein